MALTRKFLSAMGVEPEKIDQIIEAHTESVDALKEQRDKYKEEADKLPEIQKQLDEALEAAKGDSQYKAKYEKEHADFEKYKTDQAEKETKAKKTAAYKKLLKEAGVADKHIDTVLKTADLSTIDFDEKGNVKDSKNIIKGIQTEWDDIIAKPGTQGANTPTPPSNNGGSDSFDSYAAKRYNAWYDRRYGKVPDSAANNTNGGNE